MLIMFSSYFVLVCAKEHVLGIINLPSSLGRMWVLVPIILLFGGLSHASVACFVAKQTCLVLWLINLLSGVIINLRGLSWLLSLLMIS